MTARRPVLCIETGEVYPSVTMAADCVGVARATISRAIRNDYRARGQRWRYVDHRPEDTKPPRRRKRNRPVVASDGRQWENINEAARETCYAVGSIYWAIYNRKPIGGLHWSYVA